MRIVFFNWRDVKNPKSGGAEILTHEISKGLIKKGHTVTLFSSNFAGAKKKETIDGIKIIRDGDPDLRALFSSVQYKAYQHYKKKSFGKIDVLVDEVHGVPFFTPLYAKEKKVALICEYAGDLWDKAVAPPFNILGKAVEKIYPSLYSNTCLITISDSSKNDLEKNLFRNKKFQVIHPGCNAPIVNKVPARKDPLTLIFIARLSKSKGVADAILATLELKKIIKNVSLHIIGRGEENYVSSLEKLVHEKNLGENVTFHGYVSEEEKIKLIDRSHFLIIASDKEGWGLTVHEANSRGVPAISYNIKGVRDVLKKGVNGILTKKNNPSNLAQEILTAYNNKTLYNSMVKNSIIERKKFTWGNTADEFLKVIQK